MSKPKTVLIVEDDEAIRSSIAELLSDEGYEVRVASDGSQAIKDLKQNQAPDLILLDLMMPTMDAFQFRSEQFSNRLHVDVPVVVMSAHPNIRTEAERIQVSTFIRKPIDIDQMMDTVKKLAH
jgi:DNA-binding NtrC family response regulator